MNTLPFDPSMPYEGVGLNKGCPPGYFCQYVQPSDLDASQPVEAGIVPGGTTAVRCRQIEGYTPAVNAQETGQVAADTWLNQVNSVGEIANAAVSFALEKYVPWIIGGLAAWWFINRRA